MTEGNTDYIRRLSQATQKHERHAIAVRMTEERRIIRELNHTPLYGLDNLKQTASYFKEKASHTQEQLEARIYELTDKSQTLSNRIRAKLGIPDSKEVSSVRKHVQDTQAELDEIKHNQEVQRKNLEAAEENIKAAEERLRLLKQESNVLREKLELVSGEFGPDSEVIKKLFKNRNVLWDGIAPHDVALEYVRSKDTVLADKMTELFISEDKHSIGDRVRKYIIEKYVRDDQVVPIPIEVTHALDQNMIFLPKHRRIEILHDRFKHNTPEEFNQIGEKDSCFWHVLSSHSSLEKVLSSGGVSSHRTLIAEGSEVRFSTVGGGGTVYLNRDGVRESTQGTTYSWNSKKVTEKSDGKSYTQEFDQVYVSLGSAYTESKVAIIFSARQLLKDFQIGNHCDGYPLFDKYYDSEKIDIDSEKNGWPTGVHGAKIDMNKYDFAIAMNEENSQNQLELLIKNFSKMPNPNNLSIEEWIMKHIILVGDICSNEGAIQVETTFNLRNWDIPHYNSTLEPTGNVGDTASGGLCNLYQVKEISCSAKIT